MTSADIRQSFLDFFRSKKHTIVPSSSLLPDAPNLLFTNAGMNQFVPIFLGQRAPDVSKWPGVVPGSDTRAADTQKCIRAGGKHNDLEDVGLDTYHHTFFEMLGNWSFGDYFKKEAIDWAWELITEIWKFPKNRLYATVYSPARSKGDPSDFDQEAHDIWAEKFRSAGLDPKVHIVNGNKKDNFWMMGDTGPCGPCSEIHVDLTPNGDTKGSLVNKGNARCIEIWNLVFIQFNAEPDGPEEAAKMTKPGAKAGIDWRQRFVPLPARHVDTGMGFERVTGIIQNTNNFTDFSRVISNYETDIFRPLFDKLQQLSGKKYTSTLPSSDLSTINPQQSTDVAFRVIADHIRTLSFAISDGIQPGIKARNGVLRSIHKRMVRYASTIGVQEDLLLKTQDGLVDTLAATMGDVFPEVRAHKEHTKEVLRQEADVFNKTLERGIKLFENEVLMNALTAGANLQGLQMSTASKAWWGEKQPTEVEMQSMRFFSGSQPIKEFTFEELRKGAWREILTSTPTVSGEDAFRLYDTYGFPLDLTELMARERGLSVNTKRFNELMEEQRKRSQGAIKRTVITVSDFKTEAATTFVGYTEDRIDAKILEVVEADGSSLVIADRSPFYAAMGGQVADTGFLRLGAQIFPVEDVSKVGKAIAHTIRSGLPSTEGTVELALSKPYRRAIERHHTVTHLLHWALHEVVSKDAVQKGSYVGPEKLTFDFSSAPLTPQQIADVEKLVNERILENARVSWTEVPYSEVKSRKDVMQLFGEKYSDKVRVVQIGGKPTALDGYSMELCGGTHTRATGEIGLFRIVAESATGAGIRRIEAVAGLEAYKQANEQLQLIKTLAGKINTPVTELEKKIESLLTQQKDLEKQLKAAQQKQAAETARTLTAKAQTIGSTRAIIEKVSPADGDYLQSIADSLKGQFNGVVVLGGSTNGAVALVATVSPDLTKQFQAGKIIQTIAPIVGGKGGGRPDNARGGGKEVAKLDEALAKATSLLG